jgi:hypothetical protein
VTPASSDEQDPCELYSPERVSCAGGKWLAAECSVAAEEVVDAVSPITPEG